MKDRIEMIWCNKFREMVKINKNNYEIIIKEYLKYCGEEEKKLFLRFKTNRDGKGRVIDDEIEKIRRKK
jgi:hypothetical protein